MRALFPLLAFFFCSSAFASWERVNIDGYEVANLNGKYWTFTAKDPWKTAAQGGRTYETDFSHSSPRASSKYPVPYRSKVPAFFDVSAQVVPRTFAKSAAAILGTAAGGVAGVAGVACAVACDAIWDWASGSVPSGTEFAVNPDGVMTPLLPSETQYRSDGYRYSIRNYPQFNTPSADLTCSNFASYWNTSGTGSSNTLISAKPASQRTLCRIEYNTSGSTVLRTVTYDMLSHADTVCLPGMYIHSDGHCSSTVPTDHYSLSEFEDHLRSYAERSWDAAAAKAAAQTASVGYPWTNDAEGEITVTGPSTVPVSEQTTTTQTRVDQGTTNESSSGSDSATKTTTRTTSAKNTYDGNRVSTTTVTTIITNIINNNTGGSSSSTTIIEDDDPPEEDIVDSPVPDLPELYKQKYPDGLTGVVSQKVAAIKATPLFQLPNQLMGNLPNTGSCPSWTLDLNLASWASLGIWNIGADCSVWAFGKVCIIIGALLLARALITGG